MEASGCITRAHLMICSQIQCSAISQTLIVTWLNWLAVGAENFTWLPMHRMNKCNNSLAFVEPGQH